MFRLWFILGRMFLLNVVILLGCKEFKKLSYNRWREEKGYGFRWRIESLFSAVKRTFGESVRATRHYMLTPLTNLWG